MNFDFNMKQWLIGVDCYGQSTALHFGPFSVWWAQRGSQLEYDLNQIGSDHD